MYGRGGYFVTLRVSAYCFLDISAGSHTEPKFTQTGTLNIAERAISNERLKNYGLLCTSVVDVKKTRKLTRVLVVYACNLQSWRNNSSAEQNIKVRQQKKPKWKNYEAQNGFVDNIYERQEAKAHQRHRVSSFPLGVQSHLTPYTLHVRGDQL